MRWSQGLTETELDSKCTDSPRMVKGHAAGGAHRTEHRAREVSRGGLEHAVGEGELDPRGFRGGVLTLLVPTNLCTFSAPKPPKVFFINCERRLFTSYGFFFWHCMAHSTTSAVANALPSSQIIGCQQRAVEHLFWALPASEKRKTDCVIKERPGGCVDYSLCCPYAFLP